MEITSLQTSHIDQAAELFAASFRRLRRAVPILPEQMENPACTAEKLKNLLAHSAGVAAAAGVAAVQDGRLAGFLGWWIVDDFRNTRRRAAYVPVWAHAVLAEESADQAAVTRRLYRAATQAWFEAGCQVQAVTCLADDPLLEKFWFWNGFGGLVADAIRPAVPLGLNALSRQQGRSLRLQGRSLLQQGLLLRQAALPDAPLMAELEGEHWQHYGQPPVQMMSSAASSTEECAALIADPANSVWLAFAGTESADSLAGYLRFEAAGEGASAVVGSPSTIACTGAYTRPAYRGRGTAQALLDAALAHFAAQGIQRCSVDFETINPEASAFWLRFFTPVCISVMRVPERV